MKFFSTIRNNWKKSLFGFCAITYGTNYLIERKNTADLLQAYCYEALKHSREVVNPEHSIKRVTIFLNPIANKEHGRFLYDKNVAPLLHLAGLDVRLIRLDKNSEANAYMKELDIDDTDCIVVAGGNATLNECISGLINRPDSSQFLQRIAIGVIPIGQTNSFAQKWFMKLGLKQTKEVELRLLADSAMSIIKGVTKPADLMRVTLIQNQEDAKEEKDDFQKRGAYTLLKENKIYALSNVSAGFVTETDAYLDDYAYFWKLKWRMNRYFMDRYLRRQPVKFNLNYKLKCNGCSNCLNENELKEKLDNLIKRKTNVKTQTGNDNDKNQSILHFFYKKFFKLGKFQLKESPTAVQNRLKQKKIYEDLIERSKQTNEDCGKLFETKQVQSQIIASINENIEEETNMESPESTGINTVIVKDPDYNIKDMFLAQRKNLKEFELSKINLNEKNIKFKNQEDNLDNFFCVDIDGEIYKLDNQPNRNFKIQCEILEKKLKLLKHDPNLSMSIVANSSTKIYLNKKLNKQLELNDKMPSLKPFEWLYLKYWQKEKEVNQSQSASSF